MIVIPFEIVVMYETVLARSGRQWDYVYMQDLGIDIKDCLSFRDFFEIERPNSFYRENNVNQVMKYSIESLDDSTDSMDDVVITFFKSLKSVTMLSQNKESSVDDFGKAVFNLLGYNRNPKLNIHEPTKIKYLISGQNVEASPDIAIENDKKIFLIVQEDKSYRTTKRNEHSEAEPQLIAEILGAFYNNTERSRGRLTSQKIYGIILLGSYCTFYKFNVTRNIIGRIADGERCADIKDIALRFSIGIKDPNFLLSKDNMKEAFMCYEALRLKIVSSL